MFDTTDQLAVNTIRTLSLDAIQKQIQDILDFNGLCTNGLCTLEQIS